MSGFAVSNGSKASGYWMPPPPQASNRRSNTNNTEDMARKIEAWAMRNTAEELIPDIRSMSRSSDDRATTVVIHDSDKHERVFTESELMAMMNDVKCIAAEHSQKCYTNRIEQMTPPAPVAFLIDNYLRQSHGLSSDPA